MKLKPLFIVFTVWCVITVKSEPSTAWDLVGDSVTYSDTVTDSAHDFSTRRFNLSQISSSEAAAMKSVDIAGEYTLTRVIMSIDGSVAGAVKFENKSPAASAAHVYMIDGKQPLSKSEVPANWTKVNFDGLSAFEGAGTLTPQVDLQGTWVADDSPDTRVSISAPGGSDVAAAYFYDYASVPEPSSAFLLGIGVAVLALRRKISSDITFTIQF